MRKQRSQFYRWVHAETGILYDIGRFSDGRIHNPKDYPEEVVVRALDNALEQDLVKRKEAARKAAVTRKRRRAKLIWEIAKGIVEGKKYGPRQKCALCGKGLTDQQSIDRGIGSDCWQGVLSETERMRDQRQRQGVIDGLLTFAQ
jgi:hypothetical protein